ncbi:hypothetical protein Mal15_23190 [Stieleria maiorica]|uniref:Uncharacterized protein n=1 Tax=Stieleria maiorica TaxID=2795974 RepID=A0A5B9MCM8_9BACT|nr:hypothetical protein Mal15_23190 [Stieleria maiorica]
MGETTDEFDGAEHRQFVFSLCVEFPHSDIPLLTERMRQFNASERGAAYREERGVA